MIENHEKEKKIKAECKELRADVNWPLRNRSYCLSGLNGLLHTGCAHRFYCKGMKSIHD